MADSKTGDAKSVWIQEQLDAAVDEILVRGVIDDKIAEARPVWSIHENLLLGQVRLPSEPKDYLWVVCGNVPTDCIAGATANTARDAIRHFALKWQLDATRQDDKSIGELLASKAEELYAMAEEDRLWEGLDG